MGFGTGRLGGTEGNAALTSAIALVLTLLLAAEGVTILDLGGLRTPHMFIGMVLIPPVLAKIGSTGYRFFRYYAGARAYREKGPPALPLRLLAPVLVAATLTVFATGVALLIAGHDSDVVLEIHKVSFIVWGAVFAVHFLAHLPRMARSLRWDWTKARRRAIPASRARLIAVLSAVAVGLVTALALLGAITSWDG